jgi:glycine betaine/proline transport system substrate-binding protein
MSTVVRLGHIALSFHQASAAVVAELLGNAGHNVQPSAAPYVEMFERFGRGDVDMLVSAWLPASHGEYLAPFVHDTIQLGTLYEPYCIWGVPEYVPEEEVASVDDLKRAEVSTRMSQLIQGIQPGAGISRFSRAMITAYGLDQHGYHFENGTEEECFGRFEEAVTREEWIVIPLWHPQYLHYRYRIRALHEPLGLLGGTDQAKLILRKDRADALGSDLLHGLGRMHLGNRVVSELAYRFRVEGIEPDQAARHWLSANNAMVQTWFHGVPKAVAK